MRKLIVSEWVTLDGVFDADTMPQWEIPYMSAERIEYIQGGILGADAIIFGRASYEVLAGFWPTQKNNEMGVADKLNNVSKFVVSTTLKKAEWNNSVIIKENVVEEITKLKKQAGREILIIGSATLVHSLMETDLIDEYRFLVNPIIMGSGKRFFREGMHITRLNLVKTNAIDLGVIALTYQPVKD